MTRLTMSSFRTKVSRPGIERTEQGVKVFYTRKQLEAINKRSAAKPAKTVKTRKKVRKVSNAKQ